MSIEDEVDMEDFLQRWGMMGPEEAHIYARVDANRHVLARRIRIARRFLTAVHDFSRNEIVVVSMERSILRAVRSASLYLGPHPALVPNRRWTG